MHGREGMGVGYIRDRTIKIESWDFSQWEFFCKSAGTHKNGIN